MVLRSSYLPFMNYFAILPSGDLAVSGLCMCGAKDIEIYNIETGKKTSTIHVATTLPEKTHVSVVECQAAGKGQEEASGELVVLPEGRLACPGSRTSGLEIFR